MDALKFFKERMRMCDYYDGMDDGCNTCPRVNKGCELSTYRDYDYIKEYIADVEKWSKEHPQRTRLQDLLEKFPKVEIDKEGLPFFFVVLDWAMFALVRSLLVRTVGICRWRRMNNDKKRKYYIVVRINKR